MNSTQKKSFFLIILLISLVSTGYSTWFTKIVTMDLNNANFEGNYHDDWVEDTNTFPSACSEFIDDGVCWGDAVGFTFNENGVASSKNLLLTQELSTETPITDYNISYHYHVSNTNLARCLTVAVFGYDSDDNLELTCSQGVCYGTSYGYKTCSLTSTDDIAKIGVRFNGDYGCEGFIGNLSVSYEGGVYEMNIQHPEEDTTYYNYITPVSIETSLENAGLEYDIDGEGYTSMSLIATSDSYYYWGVNLYNLEEGSHTVTIRDRLLNTVTTNFNVDLLDTITNVTLNKLEGNEFTCYWDYTPLEHGNLYQNYYIEIRRNDEIVNVKNLRYPQDFGFYGVAGTDGYFSFQEDEVMSGIFTLTRLYYNFYIEPTSEQVSSYSCNVSHVQYDDLTGLDRGEYEMSGSSSYTLYMNESFYKMYKGDYVTEIPQGFNVYNMSKDGDTVVFKLDSDVVQQSYVIEHVIDNEQPSYYPVTSNGSYSVYYNVTLEHGSNYLRIYNNFLNYLSAWWRLNVYDLSQLVNIELYDDFGILICDSVSCSNQNLIERGLLKFVNNEDDKVVNVKAFVVEDGNYSIVYENSMNANNDYDVNDSTLTLFVNEPFGLGDTNLIEWMKQNQELENLNELEFVKRLNFDYLKTSEDGKAQIYLPSNKNVLITATVGNTNKNISIKPLYSIYNAIKYSGFWQNLEYGCSLENTKDLFGNDEGKTFMSYVNYYTCVSVGLIDDNLVTFGYIFGFIALIVLSKTLISITS